MRMPQRTVLRSACRQSPVCPIHVKTWRLTLGIFLAVGLIVTGIGIPSVNRVAAGEAATVNADALSLRSEANPASPVLATMRAGDRVDVLYGPWSNGWYEVRFNGVDGYADGSILTLDGGHDWLDANDSVTNGMEDSATTTGTTDERGIDVDRGSGTVTLYSGDVPQQSFGAAMGWDQSNDGFFATATGTYYVYAKNQDLTWTPWANAYITDWVAFDSSRQNGFHSYTRDAEGTILPNGDGQTGGCVALDPSSAQQLYYFAEDGMRVEIHW